MSPPDEQLARRAFAQVVRAHLPGSERVERYRPHDGRTERVRAWPTARELEVAYLCIAVLSDTTITRDASITSMPRAAGHR